MTDKEDVIVAIDLGTSEIRTIFGKKNNFGQIETLSQNKYKCSGLQKGEILDEADIGYSISQSVRKVEETLDISVKSAYINILGKNSTIVQNKVQYAVKDIKKGITAKDFKYSIMQLKDIEIPKDMVIINILVSKILLDNGKEVVNPVGVQDVQSFTVFADIILADKEYIKKISRVFKKAGLKIDGIIPTLLAEKNYIQSETDINKNILLIDIGSQNTDIGVFKGDEFVFTDTVPLGGDNITRDIALIFNIPQDVAENLKVQHGRALISSVDNDSEIILNNCPVKDTSEYKTVKQNELNEIIEARIEEIFSLVNEKIQGCKNGIEYAIITGRGISKIEKSDLVGRLVLDMPVKINNKTPNFIKSEFFTSYCIAKYVSQRPYTKNIASKIELSYSNENKTSNKIKNFFYS